jgi:hypothetical protein
VVDWLSPDKESATARKYFTLRHHRP